MDSSPIEEVSTMDFMDLVRTRRSIRKYRPDTVPRDVVARIVEAAMLAPWGDGGSTDSGQRARNDPHCRRW